METIEASSTNRKSIRTVKCILCGGNQIYPGPRFENHLINEHGIIFDIDYIINLSLFKEEHDKLPALTSSSKVNGDAAIKELKKENGTESTSNSFSTVEVQTDFESLCSKCKSPIETSVPKVAKSNAKVAKFDGDEDDNKLVMDIDDEQLDAKSPKKSSPIVSKAKRRPMSKEWAPNSFSCTFTCYFCNEEFRKDYKLKLHLMLNHKNESPAEMNKAKEVLTKSKLDGCVHKCAICSSKYNSVANFSRHIKDVHNISRAEYNEKYGSSEIVRRMFRCELCDKDIKHTRNIIGAHMKMVHLISWKEYQDILIKLRQGETVGDLPKPDLFHCIICGVNVKYKREHLNEKHQMKEALYDQLIDTKKSSEEVAKAAPERKLYKCAICQRDCLDLKKHLERTHKISEELYKELISHRNTGSGHGQSILKKQIAKDDSSNSKTTVKEVQIKKGANSTPGTVRVVTLTPVSPPSFVLSPARKSDSSSIAEPESPRTVSPNSSVLAPLSTDLQCYFGCDEAFKKDFQLHLHLKLRHGNEDPLELKKAYEAAEEEIALTRRSGSTYQCALCPKTFNDNGAFYGHIQTKHNLQWREYKDQYGRCEVESSPFECKICNRVVKYDRNTVHTHLKNVHGITWVTYLDRIRKMRRGEKPEALPALETHECRVCNVSVKYLRDHLRNVHKITEQEYETLFLSEDQPLEKSIPVKKSPEKRLPLYIEKPKVVEKSKVAPIEKPKIVEKPTVVKKDVIVFDKNIPKPPKSDIQEKHNKRCSSCNITFDSRRSFIEHCTILHNMRFKTKSGQTISAPMVQERLRAEALKRKAEMQLEAQAKRTKTVAGGYVIEMDNAEYDENEPVSPPVSKVSAPIVNQRKTMYTPAGVSKWNQCKYECCFCKWTTMSRSSMTSHLHNTHGIPIQEYKKANYPDIEVETNWFQCRLCSARTKFVKDCIAPHLKMSHGMDIDTYEREIMQSEDWPCEVVPEPSLRSEMRVPNVKANISAISNSKAPPPPPLTARPSTSLLLPRPVASAPTPSFTETLAANLSALAEMKEDRDKWNRCRYQCCICELITIDSRQMRIHIATQHNITHEEYIGKYGTTEFVSKRFQCSVCTSEMKFCRQNIYAHMKDVHKMTLADYELKYGVPPDDDLGDIAAEEQPTDDQPTEILPEIAEPEKQDTWQQETGQTGTMDSGVLDDGRRPSRWNKCRFRCAICNKLSSEKRHVREHIIKVHGLSLNDYESQYGECEIHTEYFFCGVCHAEVKHNLKNISLHLQNVHSISPQQYEVQYGRIADDDVIIPENADSSAAGFGEHFMSADKDESQISAEEPAATSTPTAPKPVAARLPNPPKCDIVNPKNKYCLPCDKDFNRRQAFVEHCRTVHRLKLRFKRPVPAGASQASPNAPVVIITPKPAGTSPAVNSPPAPTINGISEKGYPCDYCGKVFSNRSNRTRHSVLSCDVAKLQKSSGQTKGATTPSKSPSKYDSDYEESPQKVAREPIKCPFPECDVVHLRTALMKRHLCDAHNIQNVAIQLPEDDGIKGEPMELELEGECVAKELDDSENVDHGDVALQDDIADHSDIAEPDDEEEKLLQNQDSGKKVPPLRVKLNGTLSSPDASPTATVVNSKSQSLTCKLCGEFTTKNSYILGRHKKSCMKKMREQGKALEDSIEVAVDFNQDPRDIDNDELDNEETS